VSRGSKKLPESFYIKSTEDIAKKLLGKILVRIYKGQKLSGRIVETEAYIGSHDPASHAKGGHRSPRNEAMYLAGGHTYVYLIYGIHSCLNIVTQKEGEGCAVLIRAVEPIDGVEMMKKNRNLENLKQLTNGPGKICQAFGISRQQNGISLLGDELFIEQRRPLEKDQMISRPRIGIDYAGEARHWLLRFYDKNSEFVSKR
jgi:DNA-3-methyladenine glycosylase